VGALYSRLGWPVTDPHLDLGLNTIVAKAVQLSGTEAGAIYVFDELKQLFRV
jgi:hypothetical protein